MLPLLAVKQHQDQCMLLVDFVRTVSAGAKHVSQEEGAGGGEEGQADFPWYQGAFSI